MINTIFELLDNTEDFQNIDKETDKRALYKTAEEVAEMIGISDIADFDSLEKAIKECIEEKKDLGIDVDKFIEGEDVDFEPDDFPDEFKMEITFPEFRMLTTIFDTLKPRKVYKWMVKDESIRDLPLADLMVHRNFEGFKEKLREEQMKMVYKALKNHVPKDKKLTFYAD